MESDVAEKLRNPPKLGGTTYRLIGRKDYRAAHQFIASEGFARSTLGFPTIVAEREGELIGLLGTVIKDNMILAGPLVIKSDRPRSFTLVRLVEAYEAAMRHIGVKSYIFGSDNPKLLEHLTELGLKPYAVENGVSFFVRKLSDG